MEAPAYYIWCCSHCGKQENTPGSKPPLGWCWAHYYSLRLKGPTTILGCCEDHARRAGKMRGRVTKIEEIA